MDLRTLAEKLTRGLYAFGPQGNGTQAVEAIRAEIAELVCATSEQVIGRSFTSEDDRDWVRELVKNL